MEYSLPFAHDPVRKPDATFRAHALVPEIDFDDFGIVLDVLHRAFRQDLTLMQDRDLVCDVFDKFHVVLDHQHRPVLDDAIEQLGGLDPLADAHARYRLPADAG